MTSSTIAERGPGGQHPFTTTRSVRSQRIERTVVILMIALPTIGAAAGLGMLFTGTLTLHDHLLFSAMYLFSGLGITIGYHRYFTHRSFETSRAMRAFLAIAGATAVQGPVLRWVGDHRRHHAFSDLPGDPHSPVGTKSGASPRGLWHAHIGWLFDTEKTSVRRYAADLTRDPMLAWIDRQYALWVAISLLVPTVIGYAMSGTGSGALAGFVWGGLTRIFCVQHVTWAVNSICHTFGGQRHTTGDSSRNHPLLAILALGEGWHNNHHAQPSAAVQSLRRGEFDASGLVIRLLDRLGLIWSVRYPEKAS
jgi:stearoyl-CoA desaturase (delta-9 desaturase)